MTYPFESTFTVDYFPTINDRQVSLPTQNPDIYVFARTSTPSRAEALLPATGTFQQRIQTWNQVDTFKRVITVGPIPDPDPLGSVDSWTYWMSINYKLDAAAATQTDIISLPLQRPYGQKGQVSTDVATLKVYYPQLLKYFQSADVNTAITKAKDEVMGDVTNGGFKWAQLMRPSQLDIALAYKALAILMIGQRKTTNDEWDANAKTFTDNYVRLRDGIKLEYDADKDKVVDEKPAETDSGYFLLLR